MSDICGIYQPAGLTESDQHNLGAMLAALRRRPDEASRHFLDATAGLALGYLHWAPAARRQKEWHQDDDLVVALGGFVHRLDGVELPPSQPAAPRLAERYRRVGADLLSGLRGQYSLALWDGRRKQLLLARDPAAARQLFIYHDEERGRFLFASRLRAILAHPEVKPELDPLALYMSLAMGAPFPPHCTLKGARRLVSGEWLRLDASGEAGRGRSWRLERCEKDELPLEAWAERLRTAMREALWRITAGEKRVGVFLGGPDSAYLIAALQDAGIECESFTLAYEGDRAAYDIEWSAKAARQLGVPHHSLVITPREATPQLLVEVLRQSDEVLNVSRLPNEYFLARAAAERGLRLCLTGGESEQLFGGVGAWEQTVKNRAAGLLESEEELWQRFFFTAPYFDLDRQRRLLREPLPDARRAHQAPLNALLEIYPQDDLFDLLQADRLFTKSFGTASVVAGQLGVEVRSGFRDLDLFVLAQRMPNRYRGSNAIDERRQALAAAYGERVPLALEPRPKFGYPYPRWDLPGYERLESFFLATVAALKESGLVRPGPIDRLIERYRQRGAYSSLTNRLWLLLQLQLWLDLYVHHKDPLARLDEAGPA